MTKGSHILAGRFTCVTCPNFLFDGAHVYVWCPERLLVQLTNRLSYPGAPVVYLCSSRVVRKRIHPLHYIGLLISTPSAEKIASSSLITSSLASFQTSPKSATSTSNLSKVVIVNLSPAHTPRCKSPSYGVATEGSVDQQTRARMICSRPT